MRSKKSERGHPNDPMGWTVLQFECVGSKQPQSGRSYNGKKGQPDIVCVPHQLVGAQGQKGQVPHKVLRRDDLVERHEDVGLDKERKGGIVWGKSKARVQQQHCLRKQKGRSDESGNGRGSALGGDFPLKEVDPIPMRRVVVPVVEAG